MTSGIEILIRFATGEPIDQDEVLLVLYRTAAREKSESHRHDRCARRKLRDASLLEAVQLLAATGKTPWRLAADVASELKKFQTRVWPRLKAGGRCDLLSPVDRAFFKAHLTGEQLPSCQRRIHDFIVTQMP